MGHQKDWLEGLRAAIWRALDPIFQGLLGWHTVGRTAENQLAAVLEMPVEEAEEIMAHELGFTRNPWAYLKHRESGEWSDGSWVLRPEGRWGDYQLHVTLYDGAMQGMEPGMSTWIYAHWELNYWRHPIGHVNEEDFSPQEGVKLVRHLLELEDVPYLRM